MKLTLSRTQAENFLLPDLSVNKFMGAYSEAVKFEHFFPFFPFIRPGVYLVDWAYTWLINTTRQDGIKLSLPNICVV